MSIERENAVGIDAPADGTFLSPGEEIPVTLYRLQAIYEPDTLEITIKDEAERVVLFRKAEQVFPDGGVFSGVSFPPGLDDGLYRMEVRVLGDSRILHESSRRYFQVSQDMRIRNINSYPVEVRPGASVLLVPDVSWSGVEPPYYQWSVGGKVTGVSSAGRGTGFLRWQVPETEGIYSVRLDMFPSLYADWDEDNLVSSVFSEVDVYVSRRHTPESEEFGPYDSFLELSHFRGDLYREVSDSYWETEGSPELVLGQSLYGYRLGPSGYLRSEEFAFPVKGDYLQPFTLSLRLEVLEPSFAGDLFYTETSTGTSFALERGGSGDFQLSIESQWGSWLIPLEGAVEETAKLSLSVIPEDEGLKIFWYIQGRDSGEAFVPLEPQGFHSSGTTRLGDLDRGALICDEYGVYVKDSLGRPSVDTRLFYESVGGGVSPQFAEGFQGLYLPRDWSLVAAESGVPGKASPQGNALHLHQGVLVSPLLNLSPGRNIFSTWFHQDPKAVAKSGFVEFLWEGEAEPFFSLNSEGAYRFSRGDWMVPRQGEYSPGEIIFFLKGGELRVDYNGERWIAVPTSGDTKFSVRYVASGQAALIVENVLFINSPEVMGESDKKREESWSL